MAAFKVLLVLALVAAAVAIPMPSSLKATVKEITDDACYYDGQTYENGRRIDDSSDPCLVRFCVEGSVRSTALECIVRDDCEPRHLAGSCCPSYDHCPALGHFPQGAAEPYVTGKEDQEDATQSDTAEEVKAAEEAVQSAEEEVETAEEAVEADEDDAETPEEQPAEATEEEAEAAEEAAEEVSEAAEEAAEEVPEAAEQENEVDEEAQQEGSGLAADEAEEQVDASGDAVEFDVSYSEYSAQLQFDEAASEGSGVVADDVEEVDGSGFVADFAARSAALQEQIEASGAVADDVEQVDASGDAAEFDGAASEQLRFALEGSGAEVSFDETEEVEGSDGVEEEISEKIQLLEASGEAPLDDAEGSGAPQEQQQPELGLEGEDLLSSK